MSIRSIPSALHLAGSMLAVLALSSTSVRANDQLFDISYQGYNGVGIQYTPYGGGSAIPDSTFATSFQVTPVGSQTTFNAFCIDLWHLQGTAPPGPGYAYYSPATTSNFQAVVVPAHVTPTVSDPTLTNQLTYLGTIFNATGVQADPTAMGALQLVIWHLIDNQFAVTSGMTAPLQTDYNTMIGLLGGTAGSIDGNSLAAYQSSKLYSGATVYLANYTANQSTEGYSGQNLITWGTITETSIPTPEPSTFAIAGLGALGLIGYGLRRRKALGY